MRGHIQAADVPARHQFSTGDVDRVEELRWRYKAGYDGLIGIEAVSTKDGAADLRGSPTR